MPDSVKNVRNSEEHVIQKETFGFLDKTDLGTCIFMYPTTSNTF